MTSRMITPSIFISHGGGPAFFMQAERGSMFASFDSTSPACRAFTNIGLHPQEYSLPEQPKLIVVISAHWEESDGQFHVFSNPRQKLYYDYYGFPPHTYQLQYPTPVAAPESTKRIVDLINAFPDKSVRAVEVDNSARSGFDHGVFLPLLLLYPKANIPIVQISLNSNADPVLHYKLGLALQPLREEGVLIVGSGQTTHPMAAPGGARTTAKFVELLEDVLLPEDLTGEARLLGIQQLMRQPIMREAHNPTVEHFIPLLTIMGTHGGRAGRDLFKHPGRGQDFRAGRESFSMASFIFGGGEEEQTQKKAEL